MDLQKYVFIKNINSFIVREKIYLFIKIIRNKINYNIHSVKIIQNLTFTTIEITTKEQFDKCCQNLNFKCI